MALVYLASRKPEIIETSQSARSTMVRCVVAGSTASRDAGSPALSPSTPPPTSRKISTACSGRTMSESPMMISVGAVIA